MPCIGYPAQANYDAQSNSDAPEFGSRLTVLHTQQIAPLPTEVRRQIMQLVDACERGQLKRSATQNENARRTP